MLFDAMRIVFLGLPLAALLLHHDGHSIELAGVRSTLAVGARRLRRLVGPGHVVMDPHADWAGFEQRVGEAGAELLVSWFFTRKIPISVVRACRLGGIGVHPSLLPRHRGPDPFFASINAGDEMTGISVHRIEQEYDTGEVLEQRPLTIDPGWNAWQLARSLDRPSLAALRSVAGRIASGEQLCGIAQDDSLATYAPKPRDEDRVLQWNRPAAEIVRRIRALAPVPGAVAWLGETGLLLEKARVVTRLPRNLRPGEATIVDGIAVVRAADDGVALLAGELDGSSLSTDDLAKLVARERGK